MKRLLTFLYENLEDFFFSWFLRELRIFLSKFHLFFNFLFEILNEIFERFFPNKLSKLQIHLMMIFPILNVLGIFISFSKGRQN